MPKLHLKRTRAEEAERAWKKARRAASKKVNYVEVDNDYDDYYTDHFQRSNIDDPGPSRSSNSYAEDEDNYEERRFQEKMRDAMEDDGMYDVSQRLDGVSAHLESYAHVPRRWRGVGRDEWMGDLMAEGEYGVKLEPWQMNDDEYAEWIRVGMWKRKHRVELEAEALGEAQRAARREYERKLREETRRLEKEAEIIRREKKAKNAKKTMEDERERYEKQWQLLAFRSNTHNANEDSADEDLKVEDIPWPVFLNSKEGQRSILHLTEFITPDTISAFLFSTSDASFSSVGPDPIQGMKDIKERQKLILRTTMLRYHPDKFESRMLRRIQENDRDAVKEAANAVVRAIGELMRRED